MEQYYNIMTMHLLGKYGIPYDEKTQIICERFLNQYMSRYHYKNMPEETEKLYGNRNMWEYFLFFAPSVAWFEDSTNGLMCLPTSGEYEYNAVGKPTKWYVSAINGAFTNKPLTDKNSVLMFNDQAMTIPLIQLLYEARFMTKLDMAMAQNIDLQSTPYVIEAFEEQGKTASMWSQVLKSFKSHIVLRKAKDKDRVSEFSKSQVLDTRVDLKIKDLMTAYNEFLFRAHTYLGIKNVNIEKSERLLTGEVSANDILIQMNYTNGLNARNKPMEEVNKMFGYSVEVEPPELKTMMADLSSAYMASGAGGLGAFGKGGGNDANSTDNKPTSK